MAGVRWSAARGQASVLLLGGLAGVLLAAIVVGAVARAVGREAEAQRAADLAALAGARVMHANYGRLFEPALIDRRPNPGHLGKEEYLALGREAAARVAAANGAADPRVSFPDGATFAPVRIRVAVRERVEIGRGKAKRIISITAAAEAELGPGDAAGFAPGGGYDGPLAYRQGQPMRPDVALAFDRLEAAARADGIAVTITSGYRSDAEQAVLWARNPDPKWVARPGTSLHRYGTELDLGPPAAYAWLAANAPRFRFILRYEHEPWHFGYAVNIQSSPRGSVGARTGGGEPGGARSGVEPSGARGRGEPGAGRGVGEPSGARGGGEPGAALGSSEPGAGRGGGEPGATLGSSEPGAGRGGGEPGGARGGVEPGGARGGVEPGGSRGGDGEAGVARGAVPGFVPARFAPLIRAASQRWNVSAKLLAAQLYAESNFNPFARSGAGAQGIAQFMPGTARAMGLDDPFDPARAIDAQAHLVRDLLRRFGSVPLALAAYNAGPGPVAACGCVPDYPETRGYVARILGLMSGAGEPIAPGAEMLEVRLVR